MATVKSFDIPMESWVTRGNWAADSSRNRRSSRKYGRATSASSDHGGTVINPTVSIDSSSFIAASREGSSSGDRPCFDSSWLSFTSISTGSFFPNAAAVVFRRWAIFSESTASIASNSSAAFAVLFDWSGPIR